MQNDLISRSERLRQIRQTELDDCRSAMLISDAKKMIRTFIEEAPAVDAVSRSVFEQIKWERDCAMQQLKDHGIPFGGVAPDVAEVVRCKDCKHYMTIHCICDGCCISDYWYCAGGERRANK